MTTDRESAGLGPSVAALGQGPPDGGPKPPGRRRRRRQVGGRTRRVNLRCTDEELAALEKLATAGGVSVQKLLLDATLRPNVGRGEQRAALFATFVAYRRTVTGLAVNLNQLAHWANSEGRYPTELTDLAAKIDASLAVVDDVIDGFR